MDGSLPGKSVRAGVENPQGYARRSPGVTRPKLLHRPHIDQKAAHSKRRQGLGGSRLSDTGPKAKQGHLLGMTNTTGSIGGEGRRGVLRILPGV